MPVSSARTLSWLAAGLLFVSLPSEARAQARRVSHRPPVASPVPKDTTPALRRATLSRHVSAVDAARAARIAAWRANHPDAARLEAELGIVLTDVTEAGHPVYIGNDPVYTGNDATAEGPR